MLEEALNVLAKEHHQLEQSVATHISDSGHMPDSLKSPRFYDTDDDEFHDAFDAGIVYSLHFSKHIICLIW